MSRKIFPNNNSRKRPIKSPRAIDDAPVHETSPNAGEVSETKLGGFAKRRKELIRLSRRLHVAYLNALIALQLRKHLWLTNGARYFLRFSATAISLIAAAPLMVFFHFEIDKASETHLAAAQMIGASLALVLSLSIIPAQRAAELFSTPILRFFASDKTLVSMFFVLVSTTTISLLLGTNFLKGHIAAQWTLFAQFVLLGLSFDALRQFYVTTLKLLVPETAIQRLVTDFKRRLVFHSRLADKAVRVQVASVGAASAADQITHALMISKSTVPSEVKFWTSQLQESAHRFIARRDSNATIAAISALEVLAHEYTDLRRKSILLHVDDEFLFAGPQSDIADVLNPIYESVLRIAEDAITSKNERVVQQCLNAMGAMIEQTTKMIAPSSWGVNEAPLTFGAVFYLQRLVMSVLSAKMLDATLTSISRLQKFVTSTSTEADIRPAITQAIETLFAVVVSGYARQQQIVIYQASSAVLLSVKIDIASDQFDEMRFEAILREFATLLPYEVSADQAGLRRLMIFPLYRPSFEASIPFLVQDVASRIKLNPERPHLSPYGDLLQTMEVVRGHYREICKIKFGDTLLVKWVIDSLERIWHVLICEVVNPVSKAHISPVIDALIWQISWASGFFHDGERPSRVALKAASDHLAICAMMAADACVHEISIQCAKTLGDIAEAVRSSVNAYDIADISVALEIVARSCEITGNANSAATVRQIASSSKITKADDEAHYADAKKVRMRQFETALADANGVRNYRESPVTTLRELINRHSQKSES